METIKKGYKVLSSGRTSAICTQYITYPKNTRVYPKSGNGPLAVFDSEKKARLWASRYAFLKIVVPCYYICSKHTYQWVVANSGSTHFGSFMPKGTILADWVECLE